MAFVFDLQKRKSRNNIVITDDHYGDLGLYDAI